MAIKKISKKEIVKTEEEDVLTEEEETPTPKTTKKVVKKATPKVVEPEIEEDDIFDEDTDSDDYDETVEDIDDSDDDDIDDDIDDDSDDDDIEDDFDDDDIEDDFDDDDIEDEPVKKATPKKKTVVKKETKKETVVKKETKKATPKKETPAKKETKKATPKKETPAKKETKKATPKKKKEVKTSLLDKEIEDFNNSFNKDFYDVDETKTSLTRDDFVRIAVNMIAENPDEYAKIIKLNKINLTSIGRLVSLIEKTFMEAVNREATFAWGFKPNGTPTYVKRRPKKGIANVAPTTQKPTYIPFHSSMELSYHIDKEVINGTKYDSEKGIFISDDGKKIDINKANAEAIKKDRKRFPRNYPKHIVG